VKPWYFAFLFSHVTLAALIVPFVVITLKRAISGNFEGHKRIAKKLFPIWVYVAVTGVIVYLFLYQIYPPLADGAVQ
jgi:putative membrane protein